MKAILIIGNSTPSGNSEAKVHLVATHGKTDLSGFKNLTGLKHKNHTNKVKNMTSDLIIIEAKLTLYSTENGGRQSGIKTGYRPNHVFEYKDNGTDMKAGYMGKIYFDKKDIIKPNESKIVKVEFISNQKINKYIELGRTWWIHEGKRKVGEAEIRKITTK